MAEEDREDRLRFEIRMLETLIAAFGMRHAVVDCIASAESDEDARGKLAELLDVEPAMAGMVLDAQLRLVSQRRIQRYRVELHNLRSELTGTNPDA